VVSLYVGGMEELRKSKRMNLEFQTKEYEYQRILLSSQYTIIKFLVLGNRMI
jgi:hypothetical protein